MNAISTQLAIPKILAQRSASFKMTFGSSNQKKRNRDARNERDAEKKRAREEENKRKEAEDAIETERQKFIAQNLTLPDEARLTKAVKFAIEEAKKPAKVRVQDKEIMALFTVGKTSRS